MKLSRIQEGKYKRVSALNNDNITRNNIQLMIFTEAQLTKCKVKHESDEIDSLFLE